MAPPGCPDLAASTMEADRMRIVSAALFAIPLFINVCSKVNWAEAKIAFFLPLLPNMNHYGT